WQNLPNHDRAKCGRVHPPRLRPRIKFEWEVKISRPTRPLAHISKNESYCRFISFASFFRNPPCLSVNPPRRARSGREGGWGAYFCIPRRKILEASPGAKQGRPLSFHTWGFAG